MAPFIFLSSLAITLYTRESYTHIDFSLVPQRRRARQIDSHIFSFYKMHFVDAVKYFFFFFKYSIILN